jgi:DNA polymerase III epsilon subunit-like protein
MAVARIERRTGMSWQRSWVAIDTETTGFGAKARILEVAAVTFENGIPVHEFSSLLCPSDVDWSNDRVKEALAVNKLTLDDLKGKPTFGEIIWDLMTELAHPVWVAHNFEFDCVQIQQEFVRAGREFVPPQLGICTCRLAAHLEPQAQGNKLYQVASRYGVLQESAHRAVVDAKVCGNLLDRMQKQGKLPVDDVAMKALVVQADQAWKSKRRW